MMRMVLRRLAQRLVVRRLAQRPQLLVVYGSHTGTAESLARMLAPQALGHNLMPTVMPLNDAVAHLKKETPAAVACVCSTYGTGELPTTAEKFVEAAAELPLQGIKYSILGLGDSSHERFNTAALALDDAFRKAGAVSLQKIVLSDEAKGLDGSYREWKRGLWKALGSDLQGSVNVVYELLPGAKKPERLEVPGFKRATVLSNALASAPGYEPVFRKLSFEFEKAPRVDEHGGCGKHPVPQERHQAGFFDRPQLSPYCPQGFIRLRAFGAQNCVWTCLWKAFVCPSQTKTQPQIRTLFQHQRRDMRIE